MTCKLIIHLQCLLYSSQNKVLVKFRVYPGNTECEAGIYLGWDASSLLGTTHIHTHPLLVSVFIRNYEWISVSNIPVLDFAGHQHVMVKSSTDMLKLFCFFSPCHITYWCFLPNTLIVFASQHKILVFFAQYMMFAHAGLAGLLTWPCLPTSCNNNKTSITQFNPAPYHCRRTQAILN